MDLPTELPPSILPWLTNYCLKFSSIEKVSGGTNNRLYKVISPTQNYLLKVYGYDTEHRLDREFAALSVLPQIGFTEVPQAIAENKTEGYALYTYLPGASKVASNLTHADLLKIANYVIKLQAVKPSDLKDELLGAHQACFSIQDYLRNIETRLVNFDLGIIEHPHEIIKNFDTHYHITTFIKDKIAKLFIGINPNKIDQVIPPEDRRLSPVDFGVHNMLFNHDQISFIDLERFGWDDPRRLVAEFINHDQAAGISDADKQFFINYYQTVWNIPDQLRPDFTFIVKLFAIDWLTVILNSLKPDRLSIRKFALNNFNEDEYIQGQINKMIIRIDKLSQNA